MNADCTLITGGAGFVGSNLAHRLLENGTPVIILDNLARPSVERNVNWLKSRHGNRVDVRVADVRDSQAVAAAVAGASSIFHFAAQVAVTTSLTHPLDDFEINARGTLGLLEAVRRTGRRIPVVYTSTNKVYGPIGDVALRRTQSRYEPVDEWIRRQGIGETRPLDFYSPYGCSKGTADQY